MKLDEKPAFGQVWRWTTGASPVMLIVREDDKDSGAWWALDIFDDPGPSEIRLWSGLYDDRVLKGWQRLD